jgi:pyrimidine operon attenuation protein / uracil phosphoribosyltransferase
VGKPNAAVPPLTPLLYHYAKTVSELDLFQGCFLSESRFSGLLQRLVLAKSHGTKVRSALYGTLKRLPSMALTREKAQLMSASEIDRTLVRLAHEVLERTQDLDRLVFIGIRRRGVPLAQRLSKKIDSLEQRKVPVGILDITLYRDDLSTVSPQPVIHSTDIPFPVVGKDVILMDDVLYTGRTIRSALDALFDHGRPARVQLLVLIDRGHRELPIEARYVGRMVQTTDREIIEVKFQEIDGVEKVLLVEKAAEGA